MKVQPMIIFQKTAVLILCGIAFHCVAQTPVKLKLIGIFSDSIGTYYDTLYFGFNKNGGPGVQAGLDVLDTAKNLNWGTTDPSTPSLHYKTNIREFEPFTYTTFNIYAGINLKYIGWDRKEYLPSYYNYDFKYLAVSLMAYGAIFQFPEINIYLISDDQVINYKDSTEIILESYPFHLEVNLGISDSIPTSVYKEVEANQFSFYQNLESNDIYLINPDQINLSAELVNAQGQILFTWNQLNESNMHLILPSLSTSIYYLRVYSENASFIKPIQIH